MDLVFLRNQLSLKLSEFQNLNNLYIEGLLKHKNSVKSELSDEESANVDALLEELRNNALNANEIDTEIEIALGQLTVIFKEVAVKLKVKNEKRTADLTKTFENITITRQPVLYSNLANSVGFDEATQAMDLEYKNGNIYWYFNVPSELFHKITSRNNFKGLQSEINKLETKKIN